MGSSAQQTERRDRAKGERKTVTATKIFGLLSAALGAGGTLFLWYA
jgi:hypothetical protein